MAAAYHSFRSFREYYNAPPPTPKGMPVNSRVPLEVCRWFFTWVKRNKVEKSLLPREKTRWDGLNTDETNKVMHLEKINRLQRNPVLWVLTWAQGLRCEVCHLRLTPNANACLRGACTLCNIFTAIHLNQQFALCAIPRSLLIVHETWNIFKHRNFHSPVNEDCWHS